MRPTYRDKILVFRSDFVPTGVFWTPCLHPCKSIPFQCGGRVWIWASADVRYLQCTTQEKERYERLEFVRVLIYITK
jgi:hypothetical protein